jgi:hypothetical protein
MDTEVMSLTSEQILQIPELAHLYEAVRFLENKTGKELFPKKYEASMLSLAERDAHALFRKKSDLTIKEALLCILNEYPSDISGEILLKMTQKIIQEWEASSSKVSEKTPKLELA